MSWSPCNSKSLTSLTWFHDPAAAVLLQEELLGGVADGAELDLLGLQVAAAVPHRRRRQVARRLHGGGADHGPV